MDMTQWLESLLSELHINRLKALGFRKQRRTFSRAKDGYTERFNIQGSSWNGTGVKWRFYLNVGIEFTDLPPNVYWFLFAHTHWATRAEDLVATAPADWDYGPETDRDALKSLLGDVILQASTLIEARAPELHQQLRAEA